MSHVPIRYLPPNLSNKDKKIVSKELRKNLSKLVWEKK